MIQRHPEYQHYPVNFRRKNIYNKNPNKTVVCRE